MPSSAKPSAKATSPPLGTGFTVADRVTGTPTVGFSPAASVVVVTCGACCWITATAMDLNRLPEAPAPDEGDNWIAIGEALSAEDAHWASVTLFELGIECDLAFGASEVDFSAIRAPGASISVVALELNGEVTLA